MYVCAAVVSLCVLTPQLSNLIHKHSVSVREYVCTYVEWLYDCPYIRMYIGTYIQVWRLTSTFYWLYCIRMS